MMFPGGGEKDQSPVVVIDLQPPLLAELLRDALSERGVTVADPRDRPEHATVVLLSEPSPTALEADIVVRLPEAGETMPTVVEVQSHEAETPRPVVVGDVEVLIDLLVDLTDD